MSPRYLTGDMVQREPLQAGVFRPGIVVAVNRSNASHMPPEIYPFVYYVFTPGVGVTGPHFYSELARV